MQTEKEIKEYVEDQLMTLCYLFQNMSNDPSKINKKRFKLKFNEIKSSMVICGKTLNEMLGHPKYD